VSGGKHTTNREFRAVVLKLDELIHAASGAQDDLIAVEDRPLHGPERIEQQTPRPAPGPPAPRTAAR
jgi:hypothetical protein